MRHVQIARLQEIRDRIEKRGKSVAEAAYNEEGVLIACIDEDLVAVIDALLMERDGMVPWDESRHADRRSGGR